MKIRFRAEFARDWVMTRESTMGKNPINHLRDCIQRIIGKDGKIKTLDSGYTDCNLMLFIDDITYEGFEIQLWQTLEDEFQIGKASREADITYEKILDAEEAEEVKRAQLLGALKSKVDMLLGAGPFKDLLEEIVMVAPQITAMGVQRVFNARAYLFSVDEGCGYSTYLSLLSNMVASLELFEFGDENKVIETTVEKNDKDPWLQYNAIGKFKNKLISFDISQWVHDLDDPGFKRLLRKLRSVQKDYIYVFRVPYLEEPTLGRVYQTISDCLYTEKVVFPPFTYKEYFQYVADPLAKYRFQIAEDAKDEFNKKVLDEKSKGEFYGLRSMRKLCYEMMYRKMLSNARKGDADLIIHGEDLAGWAD
ncbi:MAG: hypothetical protein J6D02_00410 [Lachnospira sp.]|nr:hypothetical protein [Lachnospira sp.]